MQSWQIGGEFHFRDFDSALRAFGWRRDPDALPVDPGEPGFASWSREPDGQMEYVYNADLATRALAVRGEDVENYLAELATLISLVPSPLTLDRWEQAQPMDARTQALAAIEIIKVQVMPLLAALRDDRSGSLVGEFMPRDDDYAQVFIGRAAAAAQKAYVPMWVDPARLWRRPGPQQDNILCYAAPAGMLAYENELSRPFPGGYRAVAELLEPSHIWVAWKYVASGTTTGLAYNGLVWVNDHWAWFPKPYRMLHNFIKEGL